MIIFGAGSVGKEASAIIKDTFIEKIIFFNENPSSFIWEKSPIISNNKELKG